MDIRTRRPIPRARNQRFGGGAGGSQFGGTISISTLGLDKLEQLATANRMKEILEVPLNKVGDKAQEYAPVKTGELRDSKRVTVEADGNGKASGIVEFTANHAAPQEFLHTPYLRPAWDEEVTSGKAKEYVREELTKLMREVTE